MAFVTADNFVCYKVSFTLLCNDFASIYILIATVENVLSFNFVNKLILYLF